MQKAKKSQMKRQPRKQSTKLLDQLKSCSAPNLVRELALGFPPRKRLTLKYSDTLEMASVGVTATQQYRVNSLYDPDSTGTGHQPRGFDQWCSAAGPYNKYRVLAHRVVLRAMASTGSANECQIVAGYSDLSTIPTNPYTGLLNLSTQGEMRGWKAALLPINVPVQTMAFEAKISDIEGVLEKAILDEDNYSALYNAHPADVAWFSIQALCLGGSTGAIFVQVDQEFDIQFEEPILFAAS